MVYIFKRVHVTVTINRYWAEILRPILWVFFVFHWAKFYPVFTTYIHVCIKFMYVYDNKFISQLWMKKQCFPIKNKCKKSKMKGVTLQVHVIYGYMILIMNLKGLIFQIMKTYMYLLIQWQQTYNWHSYFQFMYTNV